MYTHDFIPRGDRQFREWLATLLGYVVENRERWNVTEEACEETELKATAFQSAYDVYIMPDMRTQSVTLLKTETRNAAEKSVRVFLKSYITYNPLVEDVDRINMNLRVHKTSRTAVLPPAKYPLHETDTSMIRWLVIRFFDEETRRKAKPEGVHGCEVWWAIHEQGDATVDDLTHSSFCTRTPLRLEFNDRQRGKTVRFCLRWENTRGEKGPWSPIESAVVP
ncbi:MAG: hypothetical protein LBT42_08920 [Tannerella sp.]|jgi:hypothetical protein|nr:hypothetical protein [Tannerella sp.]